MPTEFKMKIGVLLTFIGQVIYLTYFLTQLASNVSQQLDILHRQLEINGKRLDRLETYHWQPIK